MAVDITKLTDDELKARIDSAEFVIEKNTGLIKQAAERKLAVLKTELESRSKSTEKKEEKAVEKVDEKEKSTEKVDKPIKKTPKKAVSVAKKATPKTKTIVAKKATPTKSPTEKFELTIDGKVYKFSDLESKEACEKATQAVSARYKEVKSHQKATADGIRRASTIPITKRISDGFISIAKKAVSEIPATKISKDPKSIKKELNDVEDAFNNLFDKLGALMGKEIPVSQRNQIMAILTKFEDKIDKGSDKKTIATTKIREKKEDGGFAGSDNVNQDFFGAGNEWSYASLM